MGERQFGPGAASRLWCQFAAFFVDLRFYVKGADRGISSKLRIRWG
jgi:hypothetical protein